MYLKVIDLDQYTFMRCLTHSSKRQISRLLNVLTVVWILIWHIYWLSESCHPPMLFWRRWFFFFFFFFFFFLHWRLDDIDVESAYKYVAGKHRILTTMNISGSHVIHSVIVLCLPTPPPPAPPPPPPSVWHLSFFSKSSQNWRQDLFQMWKLYRRMRTPSWLLSISGVIRILMRVIRLTNGKPCRCYNTCGYMIFMTWVISLNNLTVMW